MAAVGPVHSVVAVLAVLTAAARAAAVPADQLDPEQTWLLRSLVVRGADAVDEGEVTGVMATRPRPWWAPWRSRPALDPLTVQEDLDRVRALYRRRGFHETAIAADATIVDDGHTVDLTITITEGEPVRVGDVSVVIEGARLPEHEALVAGLGLERGARFDEGDYDVAGGKLKRAYRDASYARVDVRKHARVDLRVHEATVTYTVVTGSPCVFGVVRVNGTVDVDPAVVRAEVAFHPGERFREAALDRTRTQLETTHLFHTIRLEESPGTADVVDIDVEVREAPPHDVRLGLGYDTDEGPRGIAGWRHYNFFGGGRQLGFTARASLIERSAAADFLQPHWPSPGSASRLLLAYQQEDEDSFDLSRVRVAPRIEWTPVHDVTAFLFHRLDYDELTHVRSAVQRALPGAAPRHALLSGIGIGVDAVRADDPIDPTRGVVLAFSADVAGLGGDVHLVRVLSSASVYHPLGILGLLGAARLRLGVVEPIAGDEEVPLFERLYAGGVNSVRGYERWHVGPLADDHPLGGRSLVETSAEIRRTIVGNLGAAVFVDAGQVSRRSDFGSFDHFQVGTGFGVRYRSPVGPIRLDLGFPLDRPAGDAAWQIHVSLGRAF